jgi:hypothetical protein
VPPIREDSAAGKPVTLTLGELKDQLKQRREKFQNVLVEYEVIAEAHVDPRLLVAWNVQQVRDYEEFHRVGFSGARRLSEVRSPSLLVWNAPLDRTEPDANAPATVAQAVDRQQRQALRDRRASKADGYSTVPSVSVGTSFKNECCRIPHATFIRRTCT